MNIRFLLMFMFFVPMLLIADGDYGDAPDTTMWWGGRASFPTSDFQNGPFHVNGNQSTFWIGDNSSGSGNSTTIEDAPLLVNRDNDDGAPSLFVWLLSIPSPAEVTVPITTNAYHDPQNPIYVNVLIDIDNDLDFDQQPESNWVVQNKEVYVDAGQTRAFSFDGFHFGSDMLLFPLWLRVTVTDEPITGTWTGEGPEDGWQYGETEDWWYTYNPAEEQEPQGAININPVRLPKKLGKKLRVKHPGKVYLTCDEEKTFKITMKNHGNVDISAIDVDFELIDGYELPEGPSVVFPDPIPDLSQTAPGDEIVISCTATGWPCQSEMEGRRYARYKINVEFDPDGLIVHKEYEVEFRSYEEPYIDEDWLSKVCAEPLNDSTDLDCWEGQTLNEIRQSLKCWTGHYTNGNRWLVGKPVMTAVDIPSWASFVEDSASTDITYYTFFGTPPRDQSGLYTAEFTVGSDNQHDAFTEWTYTADIEIAHSNNEPEIIHGFPEDIVLNTLSDNSMTLSYPIEVVDFDISSHGLADTIMIRYSIYDIDGDSIYKPDPAPVFEDFGNGSASFTWPLDTTDVGNYILTAEAWDYYQDYAQTSSSLTIYAYDYDFTADTVDGYAPLSVNFINLTVDKNITVDEWLWNFGDGMYGTERNPWHIFEEPGTYTVFLVITIGEEKFQIIKENFIHVKEAPKPAFSATPRSGEPPLVVTFTNKTENASGILWDFGDGLTSSKQNPVHTYTDDGVYTVSLSASDGTITRVLEIEDYIRVSTDLEADFSADVTSGTEPVEVQFSDHSTGAPDRWQWDFGDGGSSTEQNPAYTYSEPGTFTVRLDVWRGEETSNMVKESYITVEEEFVPPVVEAAFSATPLSGFYPLEVTFTDESTGEADSWLWDFGDGNTSTEQNPKHTYVTADTFTVSLTASNQWNNDTETVTDMIKTRKDVGVISLSPLYGNLGQNFPNPFSSATIIDYSIEQLSELRIDIYNAYGSRIRTLVNTTAPKGSYQAKWDGTDDNVIPVPNGLYLYRITVVHGGQTSTATRQMVLIR